MILFQDTQLIIALTALSTALLTGLLAWIKFYRDAKRDDTDTITEMRDSLSRDIEALLKIYREELSRYRNNLDIERTRILTLEALVKDLKQKVTIVENLQSEITALKESVVELKAVINEKTLVNTYLRREVEKLNQSIIELRAKHDELNERYLKLIKRMGTDELKEM